MIKTTRFNNVVPIRLWILLKNIEFCNIMNIAKSNQLLIVCTLFWLNGIPFDATRFNERYPDKYRLWGLKCCVLYLFQKNWRCFVKISKTFSSWPLCMLKINTKWTREYTCYKWPVIFLWLVNSANIFSMMVISFLIILHNICMYIIWWYNFLII